MPAADDGMRDLVFSQYISQGRNLKSEPEWLLGSSLSCRVTSKGGTLLTTLKGTRYAPTQACWVKGTQAIRWQAIGW